MMCLACGIDPCQCRLGAEADRATFQQKPPHPVGAVSGAAAVQLEGPWDWWLRPVQRQLAGAAGSIHKPLAEVTVDEVVSWGILLGYGYLVGLLAGRVIARLVA
jgi:hypothetical protein